MAPPTKRSKAKKRSGLSHSGISLTCFRCNEMKFNKDSDMAAHNRRCHNKDSKKCSRCGTVYRRRRDLKFHKASTHGAKKKKKTTAETSKSKAPAETTRESCSKLESSSSSSSSSTTSSSSSEADVDLERNVDGVGEAIEI